ncbi:MAG: DNA-protecting protein DprA [Fibromonadaceae bacterium]|jgi:DNA processing protein|nr:DNA-protecting protein DprA [Fibromonadaceae bacterium]
MPREIDAQSLEYPPLLAKSKYAVPKLWVTGAVDFGNEFCLAMVGTRSPSGIAANTVRSLVKTLKAYKVRIVSGLAQGIDSLCHEAAIENNLPTTAVIAQGVDMPLQGSQKILAQKILDHGGNIISPFALGSQAYQGYFVKRNTIITGMSNATLIVESRKKGGAMHTANFCYRENKLLLAVPGNPMTPTSEGCNHLIYQKQAQIVWNANELPEILGLNSLFPTPPHIPHASQPSICSSMPWAVKGTILEISEICELSEKPINEVLAMLTELEIQGKCQVRGQSVVF